MPVEVGVALQLADQAREGRANVVQPAWKDLTEKLLHCKTVNCKNVTCLIYILIETEIDLERLNRTVKRKKHFG